jgi:2-dehydropantoate 2-reductase
MARANDSQPADTLIVGTGALATYFAARLSATGQRVNMLGTWQAGLEALQKGGARLVGTDGLEHAYPVSVTNSPSDCRQASFALVLVKSWQSKLAASQLAQCLADDGLALTLQNGLGNRQDLIEVLGQERVALGITTIGVTLLGPGLARVGGEGTISIEAHPRLKLAEERLRAAGFNLEVVTEAEALVWGKLVINAAINPLTALLRAPNGELLERPVAHALMRALAKETAAVAAAQGIHLAFDDPEEAVEHVVRKTAANHSSMLQDIRRGAPTEIEAICGAIVRTGKAQGIPTPFNWAMWKLIKAMANRH